MTSNILRIDYAILPSKLVVSIFIFVFFLGLVSAIVPSGASVTKINSSSASIASAGSAAAIAGNVTELNLQGFSSTQAWQGYSGNVTGVIQLSDGSGNVLYNWTQTSPTGEVYASTNNTIFWTNIQCFNFTSNGTYVSEAGNGGQTNKAGTNLSQLETSFGINSSSDVDGVNQTFNLIGTGTHNAFYTANKAFTAGQCPNTRVFDSSGTGTDNNFEEVLLYEPVSASVVFTSLLNKDVSGFDSKTHDFEMLVLENGHNSDTSSTPYYFYVEIQ